RARQHIGQSLALACRNWDEIGEARRASPLFLSRVPLMLRQSQRETHARAAQLNCAAMRLEASRRSDGLILTLRDARTPVRICRSDLACTLGRMRTRWLHSMRSKQDRLRGMRKAKDKHPFIANLFRVRKPKLCEGIVPRGGPSLGE